MHDIKAIREDRDAFVRGLTRRGLANAGALADDLLAKDKDLRDLLTRLQILQARRNDSSKLIGQAKQKKDEALAKALMDEVAGLKDAIQQGEAEQRDREEALKQALAVIPNLPAADVPDGADETANLPIAARAFGSVCGVQPGNAPGINNPKQHFEIGEALGQMDFERAAKVSGARFVYLKGDLARLERAIANFMLDTQTQKFGYTEVSPPLLVRNTAMFGTGQLPKFAEDLFSTGVSLKREDIEQLTVLLSNPKVSLLIEEKRINGELLTLESALAYIRTPEFADDVSALVIGELADIEDAPNQTFRDKRWLIPTAEVPLTNYVRDEIVDESDLPLRMTAFTPCFRAEAGAAGKDTRGMIRMHQFSKVELVSITTPEHSPAEHERMTDAAQEILKQLDLAHRVVTLCTGDMGFSAEKTYDIEVWLPGQNAWREISSCSNCGAFQARRMNSRYRNAEGKVKGPVHTLNGSGLAVGRTMVAILENYQQADGSVAIPPVLQPYMGNKTKISKA
jgi:seryl-tRNA synthetase